MIDKEIVKPFLDKFVGIVYRDIGKPMFSKGVIIKISDNGLILRYKGSNMIISFDSIYKIREMIDRYADISEAKRFGN